MKHIKVITLSLGLVVLSALAFVGVANAQSFKTGDTITVGASETINSMLFAAGSNIDIAGTVNGDVYCAGQTITISGTVNGDVICAGQTITISGVIDGSVRLGGQSITLSGTVSNSATIGSQNLIIENKGVIGRDLLGGSQNITINGAVKRDIVAGSNNLTINGQVGRDINSGVNALSIGSTGKIGGNIDYMSNNDLNISAGAQVSSKTTKTLPPKQSTNNYNYAPFGFSFAWFVYFLIATIAIALTFVGLFPRAFAESAAKALKKPGQTVLVGIAGVILAPVLIIVLMVTVVGIPLAILAILTWIIIIMLSGIFAGYMLGRAILKDSKQPIWIMTTGISILVVTYFIPIIGFFTMLAAWLFGTGMILMQSKKLFLKRK